MPLKTCPQGHTFFKSSDCPVCPVCEGKRKPEEAFLAVLGAPARRALEREGISRLDQLATYSEKDLLALHGFGKSSLPKMKELLEAKGLAFRK